MLRVSHFGIDPPSDKTWISSYHAAPRSEDHRSCAAWQRWAIPGHSEWFFTCWKKHQLNELKILRKLAFKLTICSPTSCLATWTLVRFEDATFWIFFMAFTRCFLCGFSPLAWASFWCWKCFTTWWATGLDFWCKAKAAFAWNSTAWDKEWSFTLCVSCNKELPQWTLSLLRSFPAVSGWFKTLNPNVSVCARLCVTWV